MWKDGFGLHGAKASPANENSISLNSHSQAEPEIFWFRGSVNDLLFHHSIDRQFQSSPPLNTIEFIPLLKRQMADSGNRSAMA